jgi:hypothetical protein
VRIHLLDLGEQDLIAGYEFYQLRQEGLGTYFLSSIYSEIESLAIYAGIHRQAFGYHRMICRRFPFAIYYKTNGDNVFVWRVLDLRRDPDWIAEQFSGT